jgi:hypothetical protein
MKQKTIFTLFMCFFLFNHALALSEDTDSLLFQAISVFTNTNTLNASIKRSQIFKGSIRESACIFRFDRSHGASYLYSSPSKLQVICKDSTIYSIDPQKELGFKFKTNNEYALTHADLDPLNIFFRLFTRVQFSFTGSIDSMSIFYHNNKQNGKPDISAGIERSSRKLELLEFFDSSSRITHQVTFSYGKDYFPETIVIKSVIGAHILVDSLVIKYRKNEREISPEYFSIPENIRWAAPK